MCTIVVFHRVHPQLDLLVAANRDELYARPAAPPQLIDGSARAIGGIDLVKGGTWMGATEHGLFVGITNQRNFRGPNASLRSRGEVVARALATDRVAGVDALLRELDGRDFNGFNLVYGDGDELHVAYARDDRREIEIESLAPGLWVLPNDRIASPMFAYKSERARSLAAPLIAAPWERLQIELPKLLADHDKPPLDAVDKPPPGARFDHETIREVMAICVHTSFYGTCSATIAAIAQHRVAHYLFAAGSPCTTAFADYTSVLGQVSQ